MSMCSSPSSWCALLQDHPVPIFQRLTESIKSKNQVQESKLFVHHIHIWIKGSKGRQLRDAHCIFDIPTRMNKSRGTSH
jgi:hypothetical protein